MIECCNNTQSGAPHTGNVLCMQHQLEACASDLGDNRSHYLSTSR